LDLSGLLRRVENRYVDRLLAELGQLDRYTLEGVKGVGLGAAAGTTQGGAVLGLEYALDERVVAPLVVLQGLGGDHLVGAAGSLQQSAKLEKRENEENCK
jgi:hypothetical protein